ncbi:hypothetical protein FQN57_004237 [Myotisia sp. PD_48]|nr:hypothetical protein FQN57_004237 [Myotisia sp. PD_48]
MSNYPSLRHSHTDLPPASSTPIRQGSTASTNSSQYSVYSNPFLPSRTSTISSNGSELLPDPLDKKIDANGKFGQFNGQISAGEAYGNIRRSLRPLPQAPNTTPPNLNRTSSRHSRSQTLSYVRPQDIPEDCRPKSSYQNKSFTITEQDETPSIQTTAPRRSNHSRTHSSPQPPPLHASFTAPELHTFQKSTTGHLRTLSKIAQDEDDEFAISSPVPSVVGLQGRRRLKRSDSIRGSKAASAARTRNTSTWMENNWMDKQRRFIQAYEYLCHIGEAKEWIEDVIERSIPPIVQLEETLRDGVTLAELVQALYPHRKLRIFQHPKLQYRHSDNIALFFQFLDEIQLPEVFRFELIDLYEKKNIPKVIHCIHALSWLLYKNGVVNFRIGNLVGQLEFEHHELEQTQRGLDKSGMPMPSFSGMGEKFGAAPEPEPEPEPVETEEERIARELQENDEIICDLQAQMKGALLRLRLGSTMQHLWDHEHILVDLQSRIRGDWTRQITDYRLSMRKFAVSLQSRSRGFLARRKLKRSQDWCKAAEPVILHFQSLVRATNARSEIQLLEMRARKEEHGIKQFQAAIRGALARKYMDDCHEETLEAEVEVQFLQAAIRGNILRHRMQQDKEYLQSKISSILAIQSCSRANNVRHIVQAKNAMLEKLSPLWLRIQSAARGNSARKEFGEIRSLLKAENTSIAKIQGVIRGLLLRSALESDMLALSESEGVIKSTQGFIRGFLLRSSIAADKIKLFQESEVITRLQGLSRAALVRIDIGKFLSNLDDCSDEITELQALSRAMIVRVNIGDLLADLEAEEDNITMLQAIARGRLVRQRFAEKQRFYRENMEKVIKVQSFVRGKIQGEAYKSLTSGKNPPVSTIKGFVHLLNDSDFDFDEEIEFERLRKTVVQQVRQNEMADQYITQLDIKIALLVKNKITLDEVIKHQKHFGGHVGALLPNANISSKDPFDLKALNKNSRKKLEHYQELFFLLQTQPKYLARIFRRLREQAVPERDCDRIRHLVMGLFGYSQKRREEYYLIKLLVTAVKEEIDCSPSLPEYLRCNAFWTKLLAAYIKSPRDRKFNRDVFGPLIKENIIDNKDLDLESDPIHIYQSAISNEELRTGQPSKRQPNAPREVAIRDPETRDTFIRHLQDLRDIVDQILATLTELLPRMPFGIRFIAQQMYENLTAKYSSEDRGYILQLVGQWLWKSYLQPALLEPERSGVVDRALTQEQKRNLGEIGKVLGQAASGRLFGNENVYLQPLNTYITESIQRLGEIWGEVITVQDAEAYFDIDEYNDLYAKTKPTLYIKMSDIFAVHQLIAAEVPHICTGQEDTLREVIRDLGSVKSNESELIGVSSSEVHLTLTPKLHNVEDPNAEIKALLMETKRCILYIIRVQAGANLMEILVTPPSPEDEARWDTLVRDELSNSSRKRGAYSDANTLTDIGAMSYPELKRTALENVVQLERLSKITRHNQYQEVLNEIAVDIRTKHRRRIQRQRELEGVRLTLERLNDQASYLEQQLKTYNDYIEQAMITLQNKKGKKRFLMPFTKQWDHERELQRSGRVFKFGSYKYSARNLADKGVLVHWKGYTERQWDRVDLTISSNAVGVFTIDGSSGNMMVPGANAQVPLDDLLQAQFNNTQFMDLFEDQLRVNVNLFLHLIMRKFYKD